jgi:SagB-type dehydrogenase family enzyme
LSLVKTGDLRAELCTVALDQPPVREAAVDLVLTGTYERTTDRYGERGKMYVHMDVGHAAENVLLQATALNLGAVPVGAFRTRTTGALLGLPETEVPFYIIPIGRQ